MFFSVFGGVYGNTLAKFTHSGSIMVVNFCLGAE